MELLYFKMQFNLLSAIYNQNFNAYLLFNKKNVSNKNIMNKGSLLTFSLVDDSSDKVIQGIYNPGNAKIVTPSDLAGMIYGEIEESNTKFIISNDVEYSQNFDSYYMNKTIENFPGDTPSSLLATGYFISKSTTRYVTPENIVWGYFISINDDSALLNSGTTTTVIIDKNIDVILPSTFYNCSSLTTITLSDNMNEIASDAFYNCNNLRKVNILIVSNNQQNINTIKNAFKKFNVTYEIYEE